MITPDALPIEFAIPAAIIAAVAYLVIEVRHAKPDPDSELSQLDRWDGLGSRTD